MSMSHSKIVVTGGAGFIGSHIVDGILKEGYEVVVIDDLSQGRLENISGHLNDKNFKFIKADIRDPTKVEATVKDADAIFHEAAVVSVIRSFEDPAYTNDVNVSGTLDLLKASLNSKSRSSSTLHHALYMAMRKRLTKAKRTKPSLNLYMQPQRFQLRITARPIVGYTD